MLTALTNRLHDPPFAAPANAKRSIHATNRTNEKEEKKNTPEIFHPPFTLYTFYLPFYIPAARANRIIFFCFFLPLKCLIYITHF